MEKAYVMLFGFLIAAIIAAASDLDEWNIYKVLNRLNLK